MTHRRVCFIITWSLLCLVGTSCAFWPFGTADDTDKVLVRPARAVDSTHILPDDVKKNEDTVINTILRVVDHKFDTLSARITALERAVNGLQYYSVRQFRLLYTNSKSLNNQVQDISTRVSGLEIEISRADLSGVREKVSSIDHDVKMLFRQNNDMFEGMEQTLVVVNDNVNKGSLELKTLIEKKTNILNSANSESNKTMYQADETYDSNVSEKGSVDFEESDTEKPTPALIDSSPKQEDIELFTAAKYFQKLENLMENYYNASLLREAEYHATTSAPSTPTPVPSVPIETVMRLAKDATDNITTVLNSVHGKLGDSDKFQRHAEHMLERLITNGESLVQQSIALSDNVAHLESKIRDLEEQSSKSTVRVEELQSHSLLEAKRLAEKYVKTGQLSEECKIPASLRSQIGAIVSSNASHVFKQLTELSQMSTTSLPTTVLDLHEVITKLEKMTTTYNDLIAAQKADDSRKRALDDIETRLQIEETLNHTRASLSIIEDVSSNTGWLPLLLDTIDVIGITANKTLVATSLVMEKVEHPVKVYVRSEEPYTNSSYNDVTPQDRASGVVDVNLHNSKLNQLHTSVQKIHKFLPAIRNVLRTNELVINLVNGSVDSHGRVELYYDGIWGSICSTDHHDDNADALCKHLGFRGGHLGPVGKFGEGTGPVWFLNPDCIRQKKKLKLNSSCVKNAQETRFACTHKEDLTLICEQMVRLSNTLSNLRRGTVEVYSRGTWGAVCLDGWDARDATVTCRQMGYRFGQSLNAGHVLPEKPTWLSNVSCDGTETRLDLCQHAGWKRHRCLSNRLAGVQCSG